MRSSSQSSQFSNETISARNVFSFYLILYQLLYLTFWHHQKITCSMKRKFPDTETWSFKHQNVLLEPFFMEMYIKCTSLLQPEYMRHNLIFACPLKVTVVTSDVTLCWTVTPLGLLAHMEKTAFRWSTSPPLLLVSQLSVLSSGNFIS